MTANATLPDARSARPKARRLGLALAALAALLGLAFGAAARARASAHEQLQSAALLMVRYAGAQHVDAPRTLRVNGLPLHFGSGYTTGATSALLDAFQARCRASGSAFTAELAALLPSAALELGDRVLVPMVRAEGPDGGYLGCLAGDASPLGPDALLRRLHALGTDLDLAAFGDLRFVWALRSGEGTAYVALASEGPVPLARLFPRSGDAPGIDLPALPRPPHATRVLSAYQEHAAPAVVSYRVSLSSPAARAQYTRELIDGGYAVREAASPRAGAPEVLHVERGTTKAAVVIATAGPAHSTVTLLPLH